MSEICEHLNILRSELEPFNATLIAVSKTKPVEQLHEAYNCHQLNFGENYVQELATKHASLPTKINWHMIGHLQTNKVKYIAPFVALIHTVDSLKLLGEINKQALKQNKVINVLLQIYIANEDTKTGMSYAEADELFASDEVKQMQNVCIKGLMGMATNTDDERIIGKEFKSLKIYFDQLNGFTSANLKPEILSLGMSSDYKIALNEGSNMVRIGSLIFGNR